MNNLFCMIFTVLLLAVIGAVFIAFSSGVTEPLVAYICIGGAVIFSVLIVPYLDD